MPRILILTWTSRSYQEFRQVSAMSISFNFFSCIDTRYTSIRVRKYNLFFCINSRCTICSMGMSILPILSLLAWSLVIEYVTALLSCIDENGIPVDHWVVLSQNENYQYYWHNSTDGFVKSLYDTNQTENGNIMRTMSQLYSPSLDMNNVAYALYNDDPPPPYTTASSTYAHAKGVILTDDIQGFWLIHSKPNWPNGRSEGAAGFPDTTYSQSLMCVTMGSAQFDAIAEAQMVNYPFLYDKFISQNLTVALPTLSQWLGGGKSSNVRPSLPNHHESVIYLFFIIVRY